MRADLHIHSVHSGDCSLTVDEILGRSRELGLGAIAIMDHNSFRGAVEALSLDVEGVVVLPGMEITTSSGHVLAYNISEEVRKGLDVAETIDMIHGVGGIAVAPHPFRIWSGLGRACIQRARFDAVEAINGRSLGSSNRRASGLAESLGLPVTAGSDAHLLENVGKAQTVLPDGAFTAEDLVKSILRREAKVEGSSRSVAESLRYGSKCITEWARRGFRRI